MAIIFFCHGARTDAWREPFEAICEQARREAPDQDISLAFLEYMQPGLPETIDAAVARGARRIRVVPLFLAPGSHTGRDLPELLGKARQRHPDVTIEAGPTLTESAPIRHAIVQWAMAS
ncbi:MAG: CbiX/SirB N-terminal domain-containing protein [Burkholderiaceae bacterium]